MSYPCPCCSFLTLSEEPSGTFEICPVCGWEDDNVQFDDPDFDGGANEPSLNEAKVNFREFGASTEAQVGSVRKPLPTELT